MEAIARKELQLNAAMLLEMDQCDEKYEALAQSVWQGMDPGHREALGQLVNEGPVYDGDIVSKSHRDDLMSWGLANRCCVKGQQGFASANYTGWDVFKAGTKQARFKET